MQVKKDYMREQIVKAAKEFFLQRGFTKTSMRDIAFGSGIGLSNIYNYFKSKDDLFRYIVMPLIKEMERMMHEHHNVENSEQFIQYARGEGDGMLIEHAQEYLNLISNYRDELRLILYQAQGSSLENFIDEYTEECTCLVIDFMNDYKRKYPDSSTIHTPFTYHVHMVWMFSFISEVIKHKLNPQEVKQAIEDYIIFEFTGWKALMNHNDK